MPMKLSEKLALVKPSATIAVNAKASEMRAAGHDIINLSVGEPDFDTPDYIKTAAIEAINSGKSKYTPVDGIPPLKEAILKKLKHDNQLDYENKQILVSSGVKQSLYNLTQALLNPGDEVIIPAPYWVSYPAMAFLAGATPVVIDTDIEHHFKITPEQLEKAITPRTRLMMINSPSNPSGQTYTKDELVELGEVLKKHPNVIIATDDIYEYIYWGDEPFTNIVTACPALKAQSVVLNGASKSYAMTGWRIGYAAGPAELIAAMKKIQSQSTTCANSFAQYATAVAIDGDRDILSPMINAFKQRHDFVYSEFKKMAGIKVLASTGAFYVFPDVSQAIARLGLKDDVALAEHLLEAVKVATVPGTAFGAPGYIRLSCATSMEQLNIAIDRIGQILDENLMG